MLTDQDFADAAATLACPVAAIRAVAQVESRGGGFDPDGRPTILFEAHVFHRLTNGAFAGAKDRFGVALSVPAWDRSLYGKAGAHQHDRLEDAAVLASDAAHMACSWGAFQVLGENWRDLKYKALAAFLEDAKTDRGHLRMFVAFIQHKRLADELQTQAWDDFALKYNGPRYAENDYAGKMRRAFEAFSAA